MTENWEVISTKLSKEAIYRNIKEYFDDVKKYADSSFSEHTYIYHYFDGSGCIKDVDKRFLAEWDTPEGFYKMVNEKK